MAKLIDSVHQSWKTELWKNWFLGFFLWLCCFLFFILNLLFLYHAFHLYCSFPSMFFLYFLFLFLFFLSWFFLLWSLLPFILLKTSCHLYLSCLPINLRIVVNKLQYFYDYIPLLLFYHINLCSFLMFLYLPLLYVLLVLSC